MKDSYLNLPLIPSPAKERIALRITAPAERAVRQGHPWLYANAITRQSHQGQPGDLAVIFNKARKFLGIGLYDPTSNIRVRILQHHKPAKIDQHWFAEKIADAIKIRDKLPSDTNAYRVVHGENDLLPGLVIDRYAQSLVMKIYSPAWLPYLSSLISILMDLLNPERIILRLSRGMMQYPQYLYQIEDGATIYGVRSEKPVTFLENRIIFEADLTRGQKTGFFLDQRDNRSRVENISLNKRVLNVFSYSGGFSVYAARGGARDVISVDQSHPALVAAQRNFFHNRTNPAVAACRHEVRAGDAFEILKYLDQSNHIFDLVIIDPPSFAKKQTEIPKAISAYQRLTRLGLTMLAPGGIFVQSSCSSRVSPSAFYAAINEAARDCRRPLKEIERTGHALDHPIRFPEWEYLKCLFASG